MIRLAVRGVLAHPWRSLLTGGVVAIGVGFVSGALILVDTARAAAGEAVGDAIVFGNLLLVTGCVALLAGGSTVNSSVTVAVAQRTRELALLRCIGAEAAQLRQLVRLEARLVGLVAAVGGLALGAGLAPALRAAFDSIPGSGPVVTPWTAVASVVAGCGAMVLSATGPARRAGRTPPLAPIRIRVPASRGGIPGVVTLVAGLVSVPLARMLRLPGALARDNAVRDSRRTAAIPSSFMIGIALVTVTLVFGASAKAALVDDIERTYHGDFYLESETFPVGPDLLARLAALPELSAVVPVRGTSCTVAGEQAFVVSVDPAMFAQILDVQVAGGTLADLSTGGIAVGREQASARGWVVGSPVEVELPGGARTFTVQAVYRGTTNFPNLSGNPILSTVDYAELGGNPDAFSVHARTAAGVAPQDARAAIERAMTGQEVVVFRDRTETLQALLREVDDATAVLLALTGLATLIGLHRVVNTVALSVLDRTRELGLLRAIGASRRQVRSMVRGETVVVALLGTVPGLALGTLFGWGLAALLADTSMPTQFTVPVGALALVALLAGVAAVVAATLPARRAGRIDVRRAIAAE